MFETVVECLVKRKTPLKAYVGRCAVISFDLLLLVMIYILAAKVPVLMFVAIFIIAIGIILTYMVYLPEQIWSMSIHSMTVKCV